MTNTALALTLVLVSLVSTSPVSAQSRDDAPVSLRLPLSVYASAAAADLWTTHRALSRPGFSELNPLGAWMDDSPTTLVVASAAADAAVVYGLHRWLGKRHGKLLRVGLYAAAGIRFYVAARNLQDIRAHDRRVGR